MIRTALVALLAILNVPNASTRSLFDSKGGRSTASNAPGRFTRNSFAHSTLLDESAIPQRLIVTLKKNASATYLSDISPSSISARKVKSLPALGVAIVDTISVAETASALKSLSSDYVVENDVEVYAFDSVPDDPSWSSLWGMRKIDAPAAWNTTVGSHGIKVCVIDTGIQYDHPDLEANMWRNPGEIPGNGIDDDGNGIIDDVFGYNAINETGDPMDDHSHGTHCAGTIGAVGNNGQGVTGVSQVVSLIGCKFLTSSGSGYLSDAIKCINYCSTMGAHISSNSWGGGPFSNSMLSAIEAAADDGHLFVAAAGNAASNNDITPSYPASYEPSIDAVVSVASVDSQDNLSTFSQYGAVSVDLAAPGSLIYSTVTNSSYATFSGTSMAAPHVAGAATLLLSAKPDLDNLQLKKLLIDSCTKYPALQDKVASNGILNVSAAMGAPPPVSESCCKDLPFINTDNDGVCANSVWEGQECARAATYSEAKAICKAAGARLCSYQEVADGQTKGTGCGFDFKSIWTHSTCGDGGHLTGLGQNGTNKQCITSSTATADVRCCADVCSPAQDLPFPTPSPSPTNPPTPPVSETCCKDLPFTNTNNDAVCANSVWEGQECASAATYTEASAICESAGARLCSYEEVAEGQARNTGCGFDFQPIWTYSTCNDGGHFTGLGQNGTNKQCVTSNSATAAVRCCADVCQTPKIACASGDLLNLEVAVASGGLKGSCSSSPQQYITCAPESIDLGTAASDVTWTCKDDPIDSAGV